MEILGCTAKYDTEKLNKVIGLVQYAMEDLDKSSQPNTGFDFEILNLEDENSLEILPIKDIFGGEELQMHLIAVTVEFRASFGAKHIPYKASKWDGRMTSAEAIKKGRNAQNDCFLIRFPTGTEIDKQIKSENAFGDEGLTLYAMHPENVIEMNRNPHYRLVPNRFSEGYRTIPM